MSVFTEQSILLSNDLLKTEGVWNAKQAQDPRKLLLSIYLFAHNFFLHGQLRSCSREQTNCRCGADDIRPNRALKIKAWIVSLNCQGNGTFPVLAQNRSKKSIFVRCMLKLWSFNALSNFFLFLLRTPEFILHLLLFVGHYRVRYCKSRCCHHIFVCVCTMLLIRKT